MDGINNNSIVDEEFIDIEACALEGVEVPSGRKYRIRVNQKTYKFNDPVIIGRQILTKARLRPPEDYLIFQVLNDGMLEEIRLDESVDLRRRGLERFITFNSDRSFRFELDGRRFEWGAVEITGLTLKKLAEVNPDEFDVWQEIRGEEDRKIENRDFVSLDEPGVEKFFTGKKTTTEG